ncbi:hypothetical protein PVK06_032500 [Gossypium arboreum]|uniref:Uncharacterized protein n=1 Tax=Gossypium arboreum TaxID=29729 RepID=A0ABR0NWG8_GOSAR|nr:hypothetical protein PVK06_032500 [Gossypium arboreum]
MRKFQASPLKPPLPSSRQPPVPSKASAPSNKSMNISARDVEKRFGVSFEKERAKRADMEGPTHGIHPLANGGGKGLITKLRELHCNRTDPSFASSQL